MADEKPGDKKDELPEKKELTPEEIKAKEEEHLRKARETQEKLGPDSPRFREVYKEMKQLKDREKEREADIEIMRRHNQELEAKFTELSKQAKPAEPAPDPETDPQGYKKWVELQQAQKEEEFEKRIQKERFANQVLDMADQHEDYDAVIKVAEREYLKDPELKKKVFSAWNPAREAYKLGKKIMDEQKKSEEDERKREENNEKGDVLGGSPPPPAKSKEEEDGELTADEKRAARMIMNNIAPAEAYKKYAEQKKLIAARSR
jgi:hypothetical protein